MFTTVRINSAMASSWRQIWCIPMCSVRITRQPDSEWHPTLTGICTEASYAMLKSALIPVLLPDHPIIIRILPQIFITRYTRALPDGIATRRTATWTVTASSMNPKPTGICLRNRSCSWCLLPCPRTNVILQAAVLSLLPKQDLVILVTQRLA